MRARLHSNDQILKRNGPSDGNCVVCGLPENVDPMCFGAIRLEWGAVHAQSDMEPNVQS
jgi:hypothetical protein